MTMVRRSDDEVPDVHFPGQYGSFATPPARSEFENIAALAQKLPATAGELTGILLASTVLANGGCEVLRPLWAEEAMHRAYCFLRLLEARNGRCDATRMNPMVSSLDCCIGRTLAAHLSTLAFDDEREIRHRGQVLREVVAGLGALFGCPAGINVATDIEAISLPSYKHRALVLAAAELVGNSLLHAFHGRAMGLIAVSLSVCGTGSAALRVTDDGIGFAGAQPNLGCGIAAGLAGLLEADLTYERNSGSTIAEIVFPL